MVFTFYSYKGGVGRSMALANAAEFFYRAGFNVLMVDWDLEAPGLERFFFKDDKILENLGVIDMLLEYKGVLASDPTESENPKLLLEKPVGGWMIDVYEGSSGPGQLRLLTAGKRSKGNFQLYARSVINFDWGGFYQNWEGDVYFEWLRRQFNDIADIVLIDSRTGITEMGSVCTYHLADVIVMFLAPTEQSLHGTFKMAEKFKEEELQKARNDRPIELVIAPSRVEIKDASRESTKAFETKINDYKLNQFPAESVKKDVGEIKDIRIDYLSSFAFAEAVAMQGTDTHAEIMSDQYKKLAMAMVKAAMELPETAVSDSLKEKFQELVSKTDLKASDSVAEKITAINQALSNKDFESAETTWSQLLHETDPRVDGVYQQIISARQNSLDTIDNLLEQVIVEYEKGIRQGKELLPKFIPVQDVNREWKIEDNKISVDPDAPEINATQAVTKLKNMARARAKRTMGEKFNDAEALLLPKPLEAEQNLLDILDLYWLQSEDRQKVKQYQQIELAERKQRYQEAEKLRDEAESQPVSQGWSQLQKALEKDPYIPGIVEARERLRPRFEQWAQQELTRLRREQDSIPRAYLGQKEYQQQYRQLVTRANELANWSSQDPSLKRMVAASEAFVNQAREVLETYEYVSRQTRAIQGYLEERNFRLANETFARLQERLGAAQLMEYPDLPGIQTQLEIRNKIDALIVRVETNLNASDSLLEQSVYELRSALKDIPDHPDIPPLLRRLRSRLAYRQGQKAYEEEKYREAKQRLLEVGGDDESEAQALLQQLEMAEKEEKELSQVFNRAKEAKEASQWRKAYELLFPWVGEPVYSKTLETQMAQLYKDIVEDWKDDAVRNLETLSRRPLNENKIREYLQTLATLNANKELAQWQREALAPCHRQAAQIARREGEMEESVRQWREALRLDAQNQAYEEGLAQARKALLARQIAAAPASWGEAEKLYQALQQDYPEDMEIRLKLADIYLHQDEFGRARSELRWIRSFAEHREMDVSPAIIAEADSLERRLRQAQDIFKRREGIENYLRVSKDAVAYEKALRRYEKLVQDYPTAAMDNRNWWDACVSELANKLEEQAKQLEQSPEGGSEKKEMLWKAAMLHYKILVLQPDNTAANKYLNELAYQASNLRNQMERVLTDTAGRRPQGGMTSLALLDDQINNAQTLQEQVNACVVYAIRTGQVVDSKQKQEQLQAQQKNLIRHIQNLQTLRSLLQQGYVRLSKGQSAGEWQAVDTIKNRLQQEFGEHQAAVAFARKLKQAKRARSEIDQKIQALKKAAQARRWRESQQLIRDLRQLDRDNYYQVQETLTLLTNFADRPVTFMELEKWVTNHLNDTRTLFQWLEPVLQAVPWREPSLPRTAQQTEDLRALNKLITEWLDAPADKRPTGGPVVRRLALPIIRERRDKGDFDSALALCQDALGSEAQKRMTAVGFNSRYTLRYLHAHLQQQPTVAFPNVESDLISLTRRQGQLCQERITLWLTQAEQEQAELTSQGMAYKQLLADLRGCVGQLSSAWFWQKGKIQKQGIALYRQLSAISPQANEPEILYSLLMRNQG